MAHRNVILGAVATVIVGLIVIVGIVIWSRSSKSTSPVPCLGPIELPKAPHWNASRNSIYFVDVYQSVVHRFNPTTMEHKMAKVGNEAMAFIIPLKNTDNKFIISYGQFLAILTWDGNSETVSYRAIAPIDREVYRANEGKVAPSGSLFVGTHSPQLPEGGLRSEAAGLYAFRGDIRTSKKLLDNVTVSNGMGWSKDAKWFYYIDSLAYTVDLFSYNITNDEITNRKVILDFRKAKIPGVPDGMAVDSEDKLWVTSFNGHQVLRIDPLRGEIMEQIQLDALRITSAVFAGPQLSDFYITSGNYQNTAEETATYPHSGYFYEFKNFKVSGRPGVEFEIHPSFLID